EVPGHRTRGISLALQHPSIDIAWRLEINVLTPRPVSQGATTGGAPASPSTGLGLNVGALASTAGQSLSSNGSEWNPVTLVTGTAITNALAQIAVNSNLWRFSMELDFSGTSPSITSDTAGLTDFLATDAGQNMLSQALAPLKAVAGIQLTP